MVSNVEEMISVAKSQPNKLLIVDESALSLDRYNSDELWLAKTARHNGHSSIFIGQDWVDVPKGLRSQCRQLFIFGCMVDEAKELSNRYNSKVLESADKQEIGHFIRLIVRRELCRGKVDFKNRKILLTRPEKLF